MLTSYWKATLFSATLLFCVSVTPASAEPSSDRYNVKIARQSLDGALKDLAQQTGVQIARFSDTVDGSAIVGPLEGETVLGNALYALLTPHGFGYKVINDHTVAVVQQTPSESSAAGTQVSGVPPTQADDTGSDQDSAAEADSEERSRSTSSRSRTPSSEVRAAIEEVIVTANRREQRLQDIPMAITALDSGEIERRGLVSLGDYLNTVPSVLLVEAGLGFNQISIRGIGGRGDATVGNYFGEIPLTLGTAARTPDIKLVDMERVEILRGPQGTLYGAGSVGGALRKIPNAPQLGVFSSDVNLGYSNTAVHGGDNSKVTGVFNIPLNEDTLALRLVGYRYNNSGYIINDGAADPQKAALAEVFGAELIDDDDVNSHIYSGVRASVLWQPTDWLNATLMYLNQKLESDGHAEVDPRIDQPYTIGTFSLGDVTPHGREFFKDDHELTNLVLEYDTGFGTLTSSTSWLKGHFNWSRDNSRFTVAPVALLNPSTMDGFVEELRFSSEFAGPWQAIAGLYYEDLENLATPTMSWSGDPDLMPPTLFGGDPSRDAILRNRVFLGVEQVAVYGEVSYELTDELKLTAGGRWFDYDREHNDSRRGEWLPPLDFHETASESGSRFKFNASYTLDENALIYAEWAQGFRLGRPQRPIPADNCDQNNDGILDGTNAPLEPGNLKSDSLDSFEIGGKFALLQQRLILNTAIFYVDWTDIPTVSPNGTCGFNVSINAAAAVSQGVEIESLLQITERLKLTAGGSYIDAEFAKDDLEANAFKGEQLPISTNVNYRIGLQYDFDLAGNPGYISGDYGYIGESFRTVVEQRNNIAPAGDYGRLGMRIGIALEDFSVEVFGQNLTNENAFTGAQSTFRGYQLRPRVVGVEVRHHW